MSNSSTERYIVRILQKAYNEFSRLPGANHTHYKSHGEKPEEPYFVQTVNDDWHAKEQYHRKYEKIYWSLSIFLTFSVAIASVFAARFAYEAYRAANEQAIQARRQADYAEPRAWIYISLQRAPPAHADDLPNNKRHITISLPFSLQNHGTVPAVIEGIEATMIIPSDDNHLSSTPNDPLTAQNGFSYNTLSTYDFSREELLGRIVDPNASTSGDQAATFFFADQNNFGVTGFERHVYISVAYRDPYGHRQACFYGVYNGLTEPKLIGEKYNNCK